MNGRAPSASGLGEYPRRYDVAALPARRQRASFRLLSWMCALAGLANCTLAASALALVPLKASEPMVAVSGPTNVYAAAAPQGYVSGSLAYVESLAVNYVLARYTITQDRAEMARLWSKDGFIYQVEPSNAMIGVPAIDKLRLEEMAAALRAGMSRTATLVASRALVAGEVFEVDFDVATRNAGGRVTGTERQRAVVEVGFDPEVGATLVNPLGFSVSAYSEEPRRDR